MDRPNPAFPTFTMGDWNDPEDLTIDPRTVLDPAPQLAKYGTSTRPIPYYADCKIPLTMLSEIQQALNMASS